MSCLWARPNPRATDFFQRVLGRNHISLDVRSYRNGEQWLLLQLLTLKLWLDQRIEHGPAGGV
jgi:hypothetical protein